VLTSNNPCDYCFYELVVKLVVIHHVQILACELAVVCWEETNDSRGQQGTNSDGKSVNVMNAQGEAELQLSKHHSTLAILAVSISVVEVSVNQGYKMHTM
jgi:hypothetical protein